MKQHNIKLICSDIDGTLLDKNRSLSQKTLAEMHRLGEHYPIVLISSRMPKSLRKLQTQLKCRQYPLIAYNGSLIIDGDSTLFSQEVPFHLLEIMQTYVNNTSIHLSLYHNDEWVVPANDYWAKREANNTKVNPEIQPLTTTIKDWKARGISAHKIMCMGEAEEIEILYRLLKENHADQVNAYRSKDTYIEVSHVLQDKASALSLLLQKKYPTIGMENTIAFGDNFNDTTLLEQVGTGVAVANAKKEVLSVANDVTLSNIEDGVAFYLAKLS